MLNFFVYNLVLKKRFFLIKNINKKKIKKVKFAVDMQNECGYKYLPTGMVKQTKC